MSRLIFITIPLFIISILIFVGLIFLQVFLSKKAGKWPGLVLPACSILFSLIAALSSRAFIRMGEGFGQVIVAVIVFVLANIPTLIYFFIYSICHAKKISVKEIIPLDKSIPLSKNQEIIKMNIQDL